MLEALRRRLRDARARSDGAECAESLQQLKDRCDALENALLRLERIEDYRRDAHASVERGAAELARSWRCVARALAPPRC